MRLKLVLAGAILPALLTACAPAAQVTVTPTTNPGGPSTGLAKMLDLVPSDYAASLQTPQFASAGVWYADRAGEAKALGLSYPMSVEAIANLSQEQLTALEQARAMSVMQPVFVSPQTGMLTGQQAEWKKAFGYDPYVIEKVLHLSTINGFQFGVALMEGGYPVADIKAKLPGLGYTEKQPGLWAQPGEGREINTTGPLRPLLGPSSTMNRVALADRTVIAGNFEGLVKKVYDARVNNGTPDSLYRNAAVSPLINPLGNAHAAVLFPQKFVGESKGACGDCPAFTPPADWSTLHDYSWVGLAYERLSKDKARFTIAISYADKSAAEADKAELEKRFRGYHPRRFPVQADKPRQDQTLADHCSVDSVTANGSALVLTCTYDPANGGWWNRMLMTWDYDFLLPAPGKAP